MTLSDYENKINEFAIYPESGTGSPMALVYCALGLGGEAGEYSEKVKKLIRDGKLDRPLALKELGDVLWYLTRSANELGYSLVDVAQVNIVKLHDRRNRGVIQGSGDER
jgi:NTP pyrophosphatase (non-canonical NTP hydrolase)